MSHCNILTPYSASLLRALVGSFFFYQPTRVLLNRTPTRLRVHNCLAKEGPLHSYGGCDGVVVSFLYSGVICVAVFVVYTRGVHRLLQPVFIRSAER